MKIGPLDLVGALARHRVAPNMLMLLMIIVGVWAVYSLNIRFFPRFDLQLVQVQASWSGAAAEDVEKSLVMPLENELRNVANLQKMTSTSSDGFGLVYLEFPENADIDEAVDDVKQFVSQAAAALPADADAPEVQKIVAYDELMRIALTGGAMEELRRLARRYESELAALGVAKVDVRGLPREEIRVYVPRRRLVELDATVRDIGAAVAAQNRDASAGDVALGESQTRLRALAKNEDISGLAEVAIPAAGGGVLRLGDIAGISREVADHQKTQLFNGQPSVELHLQRRAQDHTLESAARIYEWLEEKRAEAPAGISLTAYDERWELVQSRLNLLLQNGWQGLILVLLVLFLFLSGRVAFWVAMGIPAVFLGTLFMMQMLGGSINMISMFALIMATGIIVDDAIVVGENAMHEFERGQKPLAAAVSGARAMVVPVVASTFTTIASFLPLFVIGGLIGSIIYDIPFVIVCILAAALFECFFVLPGHLYHAFRGRARQPGAIRRALNNGFFAFQENIFRPTAAAAVKYRGATVAACLGMVIFSASLFAGGLVQYRFFPGADFPFLRANLTFVSGTPEEKTREYIAALLNSLHRAAAEFPNEKNLLENIVVRYGVGGSRDEPKNGDEYAQVVAELSDPESRQVKTEDISRAWERLAPQSDILEQINMRGESGGPPGADLEVRLSGEDLETLKSAALEVREVFRGLPGISQVRDDTPYGKSQIAFELNASGRALGLTTRELALQLRDALDGYKAQTFYEGADEIEVRIIQQGADRGGDLRSFQVRLPGGGFASLEDVANLRTRRGFDAITRVGGQPAISVSGDVNFAAVGDLQGLIRSLREGEVREIARRYGVDFSFEGQQADQRRTIEDMRTGLVMALLFIYIILAWVFSSWSKPLVIMLTMPLGVIGAVLGHWIMGADMSILSFFGVFALMGIIVNDSIVLVRYFQELRLRRPEADIDSLIVDTACRRLRAVLVTSLTTIGGLTPLMFEKSTQAQFLIPMAISICFGLAFATILILLFTPACLSYHQSLVRLFTPADADSTAAPDSPAPDSTANAATPADVR